MELWVMVVVMVVVVEEEGGRPRAGVVGRWNNWRMEETEKFSRPLPLSTLGKEQTAEEKSLQREARDWRRGWPDQSDPDPKIERARPQAKATKPIILLPSFAHYKTACSLKDPKTLE